MKLPARRTSAPLTRSPRPEVFPEDEGDRRLEVWQVLLRNRLLIGSCVVLAILIGGFFAWRTVPVYEATASLRIENQSTPLPGIFGRLSSGGEVVTEIEMLRSRTLVEDATTMLGLQAHITEPAGLPRDSAFSALRVERTAAVEEYHLLRRSDGRFLIRRGSTGAAVGLVKPGGQADVGGLSFTLAPEAQSLSTIVVSVTPFDETVALVMAGIGVTQAARDAGVVLISYRNADAHLASEVPNTVARQYLARRQDAQKSESRSTVRFLRSQLDTLSLQLKSAEDELRRFREQERVVNPMVESQSQVERLIALQSERTTLEAERSALAEVLNGIPTKDSPGTAGASSYRRLMAFPSLLRDRAATELLSSLTSLEDQRAALLARRTDSDPDVQALTARAADIESQLRQFAGTYLQGLTSQISSLDNGLRQFGQQLVGVPRRELDFARLERRPKILEEIYTMLQTRMKEAEIATAVEDPSVRVVDAAVTPTVPAGPRRVFFLIGGAFAGLLLGVSVAFTREYQDSAVRTRRDVRVATGLPVMGLIPRLPKTGRKSAILAERAKQPQRAALGNGEVRTPPDVPAKRKQFTFLQDAREASPQVEPQSAVPTTNGWKELWVSLPPAGMLTSEPYGILQTNVAFSRADVQVKTVVFTSPLPGEGKTTTAVNFALTVTQRGIRVLLVDADVRRGVVHTLLGMTQTPGLTEVLAGTATLEQARRPVMVGERLTLHVLPTGRLPVSPLGMLESPEMRDFLTRVREEYDLVILDAPPVNILTDAAILGANADAVLVVVRAGVTDTPALAYAVEQLNHVGAPVVGVVLNDIDFKKDIRYDAAYRYYDYDSYTSTATT